MKIKVVFTGGTISSQKTDVGVITDTSNGAQRSLIENYKDKNPDNDIDFSVSQPLNILSENMTVEDWNLILAELRNTNFSLYDGIIIAHGTDTLGFTASMLSLMLSGIDIPVVLVSSNYVLSDKRANGNDNFCNAVQFIKNTDYVGVYTVYRDNEGVSRVYLGSRLKQCAFLTNEYSSTTDIDLGIMQNGKFVPEVSDINPEPWETKIRRKPLLYSVETLKPSVMMINPYTGIDYNNFALTDKIKVVLHSLYHGGTAPTSSHNGVCSSVIEFAEKCRKNGIDFYIAPLESAITDNYGTTVEMKKKNIGILYDMSIETAYAKLIIAYSTDDEKLSKEIIENNIFFEISK